MLKEQVSVTADYATGPGILILKKFNAWLVSQGKTKATIMETVNYAKKYYTVLDTGDASPILTLSPRNKHHAMSALANLAKFQGRYDKWLQLRQQYNMKWSKGYNSVQSFERFFDDELNFDVMLQRIKEMVQKLPIWAANVVKFRCLVGLRSSEIVESVKLINGDKETFAKYYNPDRQALEHYKFAKQFVRTTKACYISIVDYQILELVQNLDNVPKSYNDFRVACYTRKIKCDLRFARKIFASWLHKCGVSSVIIDLLQGRVPKSVLIQHYLVPVGTDYKDRVLQAVSELRHKIEEG